ncbi:MAG: hypothetical protein ACRD1K_18385 [Acidimicrobiales bacterium]
MTYVTLLGWRRRRSPPSKVRSVPEDVHEILRGLGARMRTPAQLVEEVREEMRAGGDGFATDSSAALVAAERR